MKKINRVQIKELVPLPKGEPPEPWGSSIHSVYHGFVSPLSPPAAEAASRIVEAEWAHYMHYLYREKWNKKHKITSKSQHTQLFGNYLLATLELCIQAHAIHPIGKHYPNAAKWFDSICWEMKNNDRRDIFIPGGNETFVKRYREISKAYKNIAHDGNCFFNPHPEQNIHQYRLVQAIIEIRSSARNIIDDFWLGKKGVVKTLTEYTTYLDKEGVPTFMLEGEKLYIQNGRGKDRILVSENCIKYILKA